MSKKEVLMTQEEAEVMQSSMKHFQSRMRKQKKRYRITWRFY